MSIFKAIYLYFNVNNYVHFSSYKYIRSEIGPRGLWMKFPRWHCCIYNQSNLNDFSLSSEERKRFLLIGKANIINYEYSHFWIKDNNKTIIEEYSRFPKSPFILRKPFPGFNQAIYTEYNNLYNESPLAHFIKNDLPNGPWLSRVIQPNVNQVEYNQTQVTKKKIALHIHLYYEDMVMDLASRLRDCRFQLDLFVSVRNRSGYDTAMQTFSQFNGNLTVRMMPNRGRDIGPLLTGFSAELLNYDIIGHVHTKKSLFNDNRDSIERWTSFLYGNTLSSEYPIINTVIETLIKENNLGLVFPDDPNIFTSDINKELMIGVLNKLNISIDVPKYINFPAGTMFWAKKEVLKPFFDLNLDWVDYPSEPLKNDGTTLHAIERCFPMVAQSVGYDYAVTYTPGLTY